MEGDLKSIDHEESVNMNSANISSHRIYKSSSTKLFFDNSLNSSSNFNVYNKSAYTCNLHNPRSYGSISQIHSSKTLQNSVCSITIPKEQRFKDAYKKYSNDTLYKLPDQKSMRSTSMGIGNKPELFRINPSPPPNTYKLRSIFEDNLKHHKGVSLSNRLSYKEGESIKVPAPNEYSPAKSHNWKFSSPPTIKFRHGLYYDEEIKYKHVVSPQMYKPIEKFTKNTRFENIGIGMGVGGKVWGKIISNKNPGPGDYNLPSIFDKKRKFKVALN